MQSSCEDTLSDRVLEDEVTVNALPATIQQSPDSWENLLTTKCWVLTVSLMWK